MSGIILNSLVSVAKRSEMYDVKWKLEVRFVLGSLSNNAWESTVFTMWEVTWQCTVYPRKRYQDDYYLYLYLKCQGNPILRPISVICGILKEDGTIYKSLPTTVKSNLDFESPPLVKWSQLNSDAVILGRQITFFFRLFGEDVSKTVRTASIDQPTISTGASGDAGLVKPTDVPVVTPVSSTEVDMTDESENRQYDSCSAPTDADFDALREVFFLTGEKLSRTKRKSRKDESLLPDLERLSDELEDTDDDETIQMTHSDDSDSDMEAYYEKDSDDEMTKDKRFLMKNLTRLLVTGKNCDVKIQIGQHEFKAHKCILAARSKVFDIIFERDTSENGNHVINISDCDPEVFQDFLHYVYTAKVRNLTKENVMPLHFIAQKYDVRLLVYKCIEFMEENITVESFCKFYVLAVEHEEYELIRAIKTFFARHMQNILDTLEWQTFIKENPTAANELFKSYTRTLKM